MLNAKAKFRRDACDGSGKNRCEDSNSLKLCVVSPHDFLAERVVLMEQDTICVSGETLGNAALFNVFLPHSDHRHNIRDFPASAIDTSGLG